MKKVRSSQASVSINSCTELSETQFSLSIVNVREKGLMQREKVDIGGERGPPISIMEFKQMRCFAQFSIICTT